MSTLSGEYIVKTLNPNQHNPLALSSTSFTTNFKLPYVYMYVHARVYIRHVNTTCACANGVIYIYITVAIEDSFYRPYTSDLNL